MTEVSSSELMSARLQQQVLAGVSSSRSLREGDVEAVARLITEQTGRLLGIERVSVWRFNETDDELHCIDLYRRSEDSHSAGARLQQQAFEAEFEALRDAKVVDADDPYTDPRTAGYIETYLRPNRISAMLDAVVRLGEERIGLVCFEHVDRPQSWTPAEIAFASQLGDQVALAVSISRTQAVAAQLCQRDAELRALNDQLEQRVRERGAALQSAQEALIASQNLAQLGQVLAGLAHELNTPIGNGLLAASTLVAEARQFGLELDGGRLQRNKLVSFVSHQLQGAQMVERSLERAITLIQSLKTVASDQIGGERRRFRLQAVVSDTLELLSPSLRRARCAIDFDLLVPEPMELDSYPGPLGQVLINLLNNAVMHAFEGRLHGRVRIQAEAEAAGWVHLVFEDDGCGVDRERLHRLFDPFYSTKRGQGGCGLGLSLVQEIVVRRLGGRITVSSQPGKGCRFDLHLPAEAPA